MRAFPSFVVLLTTLWLGPLPLAAAVQQVCSGGQSLGVYHAYSECQTNRAGKRVWFVVTDHYYTCPPNNTVRRFRVDEQETAQACDQPAPAQNGLVQDLGPRDQSPQEDGEFIFVECINGFWHRVHYQRHRLLDGSIRISRPAKTLHNTMVPCDQTRPAVVAGVESSTRTASRTGQGSITGVVVATREDRQGSSQLLLQTPVSVGGAPVDEVQFEIPARVAKGARAVGLPPGWQMDQKKGEIFCSGPPVEDKSFLAISLELGKADPPDRVPVRVLGGGDVLLEQTPTVTKLPKLETATSLDWILRLPQVISPGEEVEFAPLDLERTPAGGEWAIGGVAAESVAGQQVGEEPRYRYTLPVDWDFKLRLGVRYTDPWGEKLIEAEATETDISPPPTRRPAGPHITGCTPKAFSNGSICVCGWFPDRASRNGITFNGKPLGRPVSATNRVLNFVLPAESTPGEFEIGSNPAGGVTSQETVGGELIRIGGFVDQERLMKGQSTSLRLWIEGTEDPLPIRLVNNAPNIASLEGGEEQSATTSGGAENDLERMINAKTPGQFHLTYTLKLDPCPCADEGLVLADDDETTTIATTDDPRDEELPEEWTTCDECIEVFRQGRDLSNQADDARINGTDPTQEAEDALEDLGRARELLEEGKQDGTIGEYTAETLDRIITGYETQARTAIDHWQTQVATTTVTRTEEKGDDPRDAPGPTVYGEELEDDRVGILLVPSIRLWLPHPKHSDKTILYAKIYEPDPSRPGVWLPSDSKRRVITVRFDRRSNEPGMCMNADLPSGPQDSPDLFLYKDYMWGVECEDDPTGNGHFGSCTTTALENELTVYVKTEDYGPFSKMEALCDDCVPLVGVPTGPRDHFPAAVEEPDREKRLVAVPADSNDNQIADGFLPDRRDVVRATDDDDRTPTGDGTNGDGYSAYEEYRGFIGRHGIHRRTDWNEKTLLIYNMHGLPIWLFADQSGLEVVQIDYDGQRDRVSNYNSGHANLVDQHCLKLKRGPLPDGVAGMSYGIGPPKNVERTVIKNGNDGGSSLVAHEVGHSVGMRHHGDMPWDTSKTPDERDEMVEIRPMTDSWRDLLPGHVHSGPMLCGKALPANFSIGEKGDQASGHAHCIMRYNYWKDVYQQEAGDFDCMQKGLARQIFCDSPGGTGPNSWNRTADDASRGDCKGQLIVNDNS